MKFAPHLLALSVLCLGLSACDSSPLLRDNYMGQKVVEPHLLPQRVKRDGNGNPILQAESRSWTSFWPSLR
jgi:hypothetical protein